jgi:hypothetical protein
MRTVRPLLSLLGAILLGGSLFQAPAGAGTLTWDLAADFSVAPNQANPNPDQYGNPDVWYLMQGLAADSATYTLLPGFVPSAFDVEGLEQWQGHHPEGGPTDKLPAVGVNATGIDQTVGTFTWPAGAVRVHPAYRSVIVGWQSPIDGAVSVDVLFTDMDGNGGNGARWGSRLNDLALAYGWYADGGGGGFASSLIFVSKGDFIYFYVASYLGDFSHDSTRLDVTITQVQA